MTVKRSQAVWQLVGEGSQLVVGAVKHDQAGWELVWEGGQLVVGAVKNTYLHLVGE